MLDLELAQTALHSRAATLSVASTGSATLAATTTGYTRASGSFVTDGFLPGMQVAPTGFTQTAVGVIDAVTALALTIAGGRTVQVAGSGRSLAVGLPSLVIPFDDDKTYKPAIDQPYLVEQFLPGDAPRNITIPASPGLLEETWLARWSWYFLKGYGRAHRNATIVAFKKRFVPGGAFTLSDGNILLIRGDRAVQHSQPLMIDGWSVVTITVPLRSATPSQVAA